LNVAFGTGYNQDLADQLLAHFEQNNFTNAPNIKLVSGQSFNGAYAKETNTIYLSQEFVVDNLGNISAVTGVLLEEFGHYFDSRINVQDAAGDEGDIFSRLVRGEVIDDGELGLLKGEDDHGFVVDGGKTVAIEKADLKKYGFWYNFNGSDYSKADSYRGSVIAPVGTYQPGQNYFDSYYNENGTRGAYFITNVTEYDDYKTWDNGKVWVEEYVDRNNGTFRNFSTATNNVTPAGYGYLRSETDYIVIPGVAQNENLKFGQRYFEANPPAISSSNWKAEFFNNINRSGSPEIVQDWGSGSQDFSKNWGDGRPGYGVNTDNFSARVTTQRYFAPGRHQIQTTSDDGVKVNIGGMTVIDRLVDQATVTNTGTFDTVNGGTFTVIVDYYERTGGANLSFSSRLLPPSVVNLAANQTLSGQLSTSDRNNPIRTGRYSDDYRLTGLSAGQQIRLNMSSSFDNYLQLVNESTGQVIAENDDFNGTNAQITFTVQAGVSYIARATSYSSGVTGSYNIGLASLAPPDNAGNTLGASRNLGTLFANNQGRYNFTANDFIGSVDSNDYYRFTLNNRSTLNLTLNNLSADADLQLIQDFNNNGVVDSGEVISGSYNSSSITDSISRILEAGTYFVRTYQGVSTANTNYSLNFLADLNWGNVYGQNLYGQTLQHEVGLQRVDSTSTAISSSRTTWLVIHGMDGDPNPLGDAFNPNTINILGRAIDGYTPNDQVFFLNWSSAARSNVIAPIGASWITTVADWAARKLNEWGISTANINLVGHSLGAYVAAETARRVSGGVNRLVALDPAANHLLGTYNASSVDFSANSWRSWGFYGSSLGDSGRAVTADESFSIGFGDNRTDLNHGRVVNIFASMIQQSYNNSNNQISQLFGLNRLFNDSR
jgi:pimeloyl-ACP methyl ester carboxylesterase